MKKTVIKTVILIVITAALTLLVTGSCLPSVNNTQKRIISYTRTELNETFGGSSAPLNGETVVNMLNKQEYSPDDRVDIIIEAKLPSLSEIYLKKSPVGLDYPQWLLSEDAEKSESFIYGEQALILRELEARGIAFTARDFYISLCNAIVLSVRYGDIGRISKLDGIKSVYAQETYSVPEVSRISDEYEAGDMSKGYAILSDLINDGGILRNDTEYQGDGVTVAIIDTGLDYDHSAFLTEPETRHFTRDNLAPLADKFYANNNGALHSADSFYINGKVPFSYDYADMDFDVKPSESAVSLGLSHGTHVAGIVAGYDSEIRGVAPNAQLLIMKVFSDSGAGATVSNILAALSDCALLGADVVNLSLGSVNGFAAELAPGRKMINEAYERLSALGTSICAAGGNQYNSATGSIGGVLRASNPDYGTLGAPGTYADTYTVASVDSQCLPYILVNGVKVVITDSVDNDGNQYDFVEGILGKSDSASFGFVVLDGNGTADDYEGVDVQGKIAVVNRGVISFEEKQRIAYEKGAVACIVCNDAAGSLRMRIADLKIPTCSVSLSDARAFSDAIEHIIVIGRGQIFGPFMSEFSSWGPTPSLTFKPQITAPGGNIRSAVVQVSGQKYDVYSGTSMASPNFAGAMAVIRQYLRTNYPELSVRDTDRTAISLAMSTARRILNTDDSVNSVRKQGSGIVDIAVAVSSGVRISVPSSKRPEIELGDDKNKDGVYTLRFDVVNFSDREFAYTVSTEVLCDRIDTDGVALSGYTYRFEASDSYALSVLGGGVYDNGILRVGAGITASLRITIRLTQADRDYLDNGFPYGEYVEGFVRLSDVETDEQKLSVPFIGFYGDWSAVPMFDYSIYDEEEAAFYATSPIVYTQNQYYIVPGRYPYELPEGEIAEVNPDKLAISLNSSATSMLYTVYIGALRNQALLEYTLSDYYGGDIYYYAYAIGSRKAGLVNNTYTPLYHILGISPYSLGVYNNQILELKISATPDYVQTSENAKDEYRFKIYIDSEAPTIFGAEFTEENGRYYANFDIYDNHYLMNLQFYTPSATEDGILYTILDRYAYPVNDFVRASDNKIRVDITDYVGKLNDGKLVVAAQDYAFNRMTVEYVLDFGGSLSDDNNEIQNRFVYVESGMYAVLPDDNGSGSSFICGEPEIKPFTSVAVPYSEDLKEYSSPEDFYVTEDGVLMEYTGYARYVVIPDGVRAIADGVLSEGVGQSVFGGRTEIETVDIPESCTYLGVATFAGCTSLISVNIPSQCTYIGEAAFYGAVALNNSVIIPASVTHIGRGAFYKCQSLTTVVINTSMNWISTHMFSFCTSLNRLEIPEGVRTIPQYTFYAAGCRELIMPASLVNIHSRAFSQFAGSELLDLSVTVLENIYGYAFANMPNVRKVSLPSTVKTLGEAAFFNCHDLEDINLEDTAIIEMGRSVLSYTDIAEVRLPASLTTLPTEAFSHCSRLEKVTFNSSLRVIDTRAFWGCAIEEVDLGKTRVQSIGVEAFVECIKITHVILPIYTTLNIRSKAFDVPNLESVTIFSRTPPELGESAFGQVDNGRFLGPQRFSIYVAETCKDKYRKAWQAYADFIDDLTGFVYEKDSTVLKAYTGSASKLHIPSYFTEVSDYAFKDNDTVRSLVVHYGVTRIGERAFEGSKLGSVDLPATLKNVGSRAFANCMSLTTVNSRAVDPPATQSDCFENHVKSLTLYVADYAVEGYKSAEGWKDIHIDILGGFVVVDGKLVRYDGNSRDIIVPDDVLIIGANAFRGSDISSIVIGGETAVIEEYAFAYCKELEQVDFRSDKAKTIQRHAFDGCESLETVKLSDTITFIGEYAFARSGVKEINWPLSCNTISVDCFYLAKRLEHFVIPESVNYIGQYAFSKAGVKRIDMYCNLGWLSGSFIGLSELEELNIYGNINAIGTTNAAFGSYMGTVDFCGTKLREIVFHGKVSYLQGVSFSDNGLLERVVFKQDVVAIGGSVFNLNPNLKEVLFEGNIGIINENAFMNCPELSCFRAAENNPYVVNDEYGLLFDKEMTHLYQVPFGWDYDGVYIMPETVIRMDNFGFGFNDSHVVNITVDGINTTATSVSGVFFLDYYRPDLKGVVLSSHITNIPEYCFKGFISLEDVSFHSDRTAITGIDLRAFYECFSLRTIYLGEVLEYIDEEAFAFSGLRTIWLPDSLTYIGMNAFAGCPELYEVRLPDTIENFSLKTTFPNCPKLSNFIVSDNNPYFTTIDGVLFSKDLSKLLIYPRDKRAARYVVPEGVKIISDYAFSGNVYLNEVVLPTTLEVIGVGAFVGTQNLSTYVFRSKRAPQLYSEYSAVRKWNYANFRDRADKVTGLKLYFRYDSEGYDTYLWRMLFEELNRMPDMEP